MDGQSGWCYISLQLIYKMKKVVTRICSIQFIIMTFYLLFIPPCKPFEKPTQIRYGGWQANEMNNVRLTTVVISTALNSSLGIFEIAVLSGSDFFYKNFSGNGKDVFSGLFGSRYITCWSNVQWNRIYLNERGQQKICEKETVHDYNGAYKKLERNYMLKIYHSFIVIYRLHLFSIWILK